MSSINEFISKQNIFKKIKSLGYSIKSKRCDYFAKQSSKLIKIIENSYKNMNLKLNMDL